LCADVARVEGRTPMKIRAPFQGQEEHAGQGFDGGHFYNNVRFVLRAYTPSKYREYRWPFVWAGETRRVYQLHCCFCGGTRKHPKWINPARKCTDSFHAGRQ